MRIMIDLRGCPVRFRYMDSMNAAVVAGLAAAGTSSAAMVGPKAEPWTFGVKGYSVRGGKMVTTAVLISSPSEIVADALEKLDVRDIAVKSRNGDAISLTGGCKRQIRDAPAQDVALLAFQSPFALKRRPGERSDGDWIDRLEDVDIDSALQRGLEVRAGRSLDVTFEVDALSRATAVKRKVSLRVDRSGRKVFVPAFSTPMAVRGTPSDVRFAYLAGLGAKTRAGFGCPILAK